MKCILEETQEEKHNYIIFLLRVILTSVYRFKLSFWKKDAVRVTKYVETLLTQAAPELKLSGAQVIFSRD